MPKLLLIAIALAACGKDPVDDDGNPSNGEPVYYGDVELILRDYCASCHSASDDRLAPFSLATYEDAREAAENAPLAYAVMNRIMPPFYARDDGSCQTFHDSKWMSDQHIERLVTWANGARLEGDPANRVGPGPSLPGLAHVDHTLDIGVDYLPNPNLDDDYRCFVVDALGTDSFLTGVHVRPDNASVVHHVIVFTIDTAEAEAAILARADGLNGYPCTNGVGAGTSMLIGWAPGQGATPFPDGTGVRIDGTRKMVVQMHYNLANSDGQRDRTLVDLQLASTVAKQATLLSVRGQVNLPPRDPDAQATGTRTLDLPQGLSSVQAWSGMIHMHHRGTGAKVVVERAANSCLLDLDGWSFHWQHQYWYETPVQLNRDEVLRVTCHYDTSNETQNVTWGEGTDQEMCLAYLYVSQ